MRFSQDQRGIGQALVIIVVAVVVIAGVVGYRVANQADDAASNTSISDNSTSTPDTIKNAADVKKADKALDNTPVDSSVNPNQLDDDVNTLL